MTNPTIAVLWKLAHALNVSVTDLLGLSEPPAPAAPAVAVLSAHATPVITNSDGTCELRMLGPIELAGRMEWYELLLQPGGVLASEAHDGGTREHLTVLSGVLEVDAGGGAVRVAQGATARYPADVPHTIANHGTAPAAALMVVEYAATESRHGAARRG